MRKQFFLGLVMAIVCLIPTSLFAQSTEGSDFWVTFMRSADDSPETLWLTFSAKEDVTIHIKNDYTSFDSLVTLAKDSIQQIVIPTEDHQSCYVGNNDNEIVTNKALHIWSDTIDNQPKVFSVIAANYRDMSFDAAAIIPTKALRSEHYIECYTPTVHEGKDQGTHFAIVATKDNTIVDYYTTAQTKNGNGGSITDTLTTPVLMAGQVFYVWTGANSGENYDLTGSWVKARDQKPIAVFNGNPHTNIPDATRDRDHIYSQAMPVEYWGTKFALTSSLTTIDNNKKTESERIFLPGVWERIDKVRVMALVDQTVVYIDGVPVYTIDFSKDKKHYYEFDFGALDNLSTYDPNNHDNRGSDFHLGSSHFLETSCPAAVHLILTSNRYDHKDKGSITIDGTTYKYEYCNGDPTLIWINPIEQTIKDLTFGTFQTTRVKDHFVNIVTRADNVRSFLLDSVDATSRFGVDSIYKKFDTIPGNKEYMFARLKIDNGTHHMSSDSGFIAHVYGFGLRESYGYPAGGDTKDLTAFITINGVVYKPNSDNKPICGDDTIHFGVELNYEYDSIYWNFGDEKDTVTYSGTDSLPHLYEHAGAYKGAFAVIYRHLGDNEGCVNFSAFDTIKFIVNIGSYKIDIDSVALPYCSKKGDPVQLTIYLNNPAGVSLTSDSVKLTFDAISKIAGFDESTIKDQGDTILYIPVPAKADDGVEYGFHLHIGSECPNSVLDKDLHFSIEYDIPLLEQHYNNVLGLRKDSFPATQELEDLVWYHDGVVVPGQVSTILYLDETDPKNSGEYHVCYTLKEAGKADKHKCTCPITFTANNKKHEFAPEETALTITATYIVEGQKVFVNADWEGKTDIECYAEWLTASGSVYQDMKFDIPDGGCTIAAPSENGFYLLRVTTDGKNRSFKFIINH